MYSSVTFAKCKNVRQHCYVCLVVSGNAQKKDCLEFAVYTFNVYLCKKINEYENIIT